MSIEELESIAQAMVAPGKGIIAIDESNSTIKKRFDTVGVPNTEENRRAYREMLLTTPRLDEHISGAILYDETIRQSTKAGVPFTKIMLDAGILPGIKVDKGPQAAGRFSGRARHRRPRRPARAPQRIRAPRRQVRQVARGHHDRRGHAERHLHRSELACARALRGAVPGSRHRADGRARSADGRRATIIEVSYEVTEATLRSLFGALYEQNVMLEGTILKASMVISGKESPGAGRASTRSPKRPSAASRPPCRHRCRASCSCPAASPTSRRPRTSTR